MAKRQAHFDKDKLQVLNAKLRRDTAYQPPRQKLQPKPGPRLPHPTMRISR